MTAQEILTASDKFYINLGLDRIAAIMELLGNPQDNLNAIHVAGTNGKGSVCAMLNQILIEGGYVCGLYTSPHLFSYNERIKINNKYIEQETFDREVYNVSKLAQENNIHLTEFEILTAVAFKYFNDNDTDIVILETGLGGRLDATNIIKNPLASIITTIDFDHKERLGDTIEKISYEKGGIIKNPRPVIIGQNNKGIEIIQGFAQNIYVVEEQKKYTTSLLGRHQQENLALALGALECLQLNITEDTIKKGLKNVKWKYRLEYKKDENILIDACHNPSGAVVLRNFLDENFNGQKIRFAFGCLKNKEWEKMLDILLCESDELYFIEFSNPNCLRFSDLPKKYCAKKYSDMKPDKGILTVFCGSIYMLGELKP